MYGFCDPERPEIVRRCELCRRAAADFDGVFCARCVVRRHVDDGEHAAARAVARLHGISESTVLRFIHDERLRSIRAAQPLRGAA